MKVLISAGPTYEPIDPVRFIGNRSTGKMGYALAAAFADSGHEVVLISGPVSIKLDHPKVKIIKVESAEEMFQGVIAHQASYDIAIMAAAVADFTPVTVADQKIKKEAGKEEMTIILQKTKDILATLGSKKRPDQTLVGFSLETHNEEANALGKLERKKADIIILNSLRDPGAGFGHDTNKVSVFGKNGLRKSYPLLPKKELASELLAIILSYQGMMGKK